MILTIDRQPMSTSSSVFPSATSASAVLTCLLNRPLLLLATLAFVLTVSFAEAQPPAAKVAVTNVIEKEVASAQSFVASIVPVRRAVIGSAVAGRLESRLVDMGERVSAEKPLAQLLTKTIKIELQAANAELRLRQTEYNELKNGSRIEEINMAKAKMESAKAQADYNRIDRDRLKKLRQTNAIPQGEFDLAESAFQQAQKTYEDLKAAYDLAVSGSRKERIEQAQARVDLQQARVEQIKDRIKKYTIISRFNGYVSAIHADAGAWIKVGDPVFDIIELDSVEMKAQVPEHYISQIKAGLDVSVVVPAVNHKTFLGKVRSVVPEAQTRTHTFPVIVRVKNTIAESGPLLKSGMLARVKLPTGRKQNALLVPKDAIVLGGPKAKIMLVKGNKAVPVPVELGIAVGTLIQVKGDLQKGDQVIIEGNERVRPNQTVVIVDRVKRKPENKR